MVVLFQGVALLLFFFRSVAVRNEAEESICRPFLTSPTTSPLVATLKRNITLDEDGEFACELVLQDETLPLQIRATIHEGLSWLAVRHVQMGIPRHKTVVRHLRELALIAPSSHSFSLRAGYWSMDPHVGQPDKAVVNLESAVYGRASKDQSSSVTADDRYQARREYARALGIMQQLEKAQTEYLSVLETNPLDFGAAFSLLEIESILNTTSSSSPANQSNHHRIGSLERIDKAYEAVQSRAVNDYSGFRPPLDWSIRRLHSLPSVSEFQEIVRNREPVIISLGQRLDESLGWTTARWDSKYLVKQAGEEKVQVECMYKQTIDHQFGFSSASFRKITSLKSFVKGSFASESTSGEFQNITAYLNTQLSGTGDGIYRPPLNLLQKDIPQPDFLESMWEDLSHVTMWVGNSRRPTTSRMHFDATDNLYALIKGDKVFRISPPDTIMSMRTVSPTVAVSPNGLSYQLRLSVVKYAAEKLSQKNQLSSWNDSVPKLLHQNFVPSTDYDSSNTHFILKEKSRAGTAELFHDVKLSAGDLLYLPTGWIHEVQSSAGQHVAVNYWWKPPAWRQAVQYEMDAVTKLITSLLEEENTDSVKIEL